MRTRIALVIGAALFLSLGASAQDWRYRYRDYDRDRYGYSYDRDRSGYIFSYMPLDREDRILFRRGFDQGYRCTVTGRDCQTEWIARGMDREDRLAFERGFRRGVERARIDNRWR